jgi:hypothetical protein
MFAWTVTATDILSNWTDTKTVWGKEARSVCLAMQIMESRSPFRWKAIYVDNGSEFINECVTDVFSKPAKNREAIPVFRCRPYRNSDQAHVEQKNWTHVRSLWGYMRIGYGSAVTLSLVADSVSGAVAVSDTDPDSDPDSVYRHRYCHKEGQSYGYKILFLR